MSIDQWFSTFFVPRPILATHYNPTTPILGFFGHFSVIDRIKKKEKTIGRNVRKCRVVDTVAVSFNAIMGLMTEMSPRQTSVPI